jgi:hypothetical protein
MEMDKSESKKTDHIRLKRSVGVIPARRFVLIEWQTTLFSDIPLLLKIV